jgi:hypothetical protein
MGGPMSNAKIQSSNEADSKRNFHIRAFGIDLTFGFWHLDFNAILF